ncbi:MAG: hypothetical protein PHY02_04715 [Phycisphaerae bacterium]|nr:hypothetical protein [Phycisphaerae bacterium]
METSSYDLDIRQKASELIDLIKTSFITSDGLLARNYPVTSRTLFTDFDDIVPFFIFFGETEFLLSQVRLIRRKNESFLSLCSSDGVLVTRSIDEWFGGLYAIWEKTADNVTYDLLKESVEFVLEYLMKDGFFSAAFYPESKKAVSYYEPWSAGLLETFCEMRQEFPAGFEQAQKVLQNWLKDDYFSEHHLFPYRVYSSSLKKFIQEKVLSATFPSRRSSRPSGVTGPCGTRLLKSFIKQVLFYSINGLYSQLMKSNSTCAFALLEFYKSTGDQFWLQSLLEWINSAIENFCDNGKVYMEFVPKSGAKRGAGITPAFILVDVICDTLYFAENHVAPYKDKFMSVAEEIIDYAWRGRLYNGLVPYHHGGDFAHIDSQVDFGVSLRRYAQLSGQQAYMDKSLELTRRALEMHYSPEGYFTYSGNVSKNVIDPKYNALLLKGFANLITMDEPLYPHRYSLFKDR